MSIKDFLKKQFIDIIQWTETDEETLSWQIGRASCRERV